MALHVWYEKIVGKNIYHLEMWTNDLSTLREWMISRSVFGLTAATLSPQKIAFDNDIEFFTIHQINNNAGDCLFSDGFYISEEWCAPAIGTWLDITKEFTQGVVLGTEVF